MREGLRSSSSKKGELEGVKVDDLNPKGDPDVVLSGKDEKCCSKVKKNNVKSNVSLCVGGVSEEGCKGMEVEVEGAKTVLRVECSMLNDGEKDEGKDCLMVTVNVEGAEKEKNLQSVKEIDDKGSCPEEMIIDAVRSDSDAVIVGGEKVGGCEVSDMEAEPVRVQVVAKVLRSRVVNGEVSGGGGRSKVVSAKRKRESDNNPGEGVVSGKEESETSALNSERAVKRGRPKKAIDVSEGEAVEMKNVNAVSEAEDDHEDVKRNSVSGKEESETSAFNSERVVKRGRPRKAVGVSEGEAVAVKNVDAVSEAEDEDAKRNSVSGKEESETSAFNSERVVKRGRPRKAVGVSGGEVVEIKNVDAVSEAEDEDAKRNLVSGKEERETSAFNSERVVKRGRPRKAVGVSEGQVVEIRNVNVVSEPADQNGDVKRNSVKTRKKNGKRGRPRKIIDHPVEEVLQLNNVPFVLEAEDEKLDGEKVQHADGAANGVKKKSGKTKKKKGKRGRPKKIIDLPEEEIVQLNNVPFISDEEDEELSDRTVGTPKQKGKRGRPKKSTVGSPEGNMVQKNKSQPLSGVADEALSKKAAKRLKKKGKRGRPKKSLDFPDGEVDCALDHKAGGVMKKLVGKFKLKRGPGRPKKSEKVVHGKKVQFREVDGKSERVAVKLSKNAVQSLLKKRKRGRPKKEEGDGALLKTKSHGKGKAKNEAKLKVSLVGTPLRRSTRDIYPDKMQNGSSNGVVGMKGFVLDGKISTGPDGNVVRSSSKGQENMSTDTKKRKRGDKVGSLSFEKNLIRNQIVDMLMAAGWTVEHRPRQGREYNDAVYVNPDGKTHWSVTKAYFTLKQEFEESKVVSGEEAKPKFVFTPIPDDVLSKLFRVVSKTRSDKNKRKKEGSGGGKKRKPAIRSGSQNKRRCALLVRRSKSSESDGGVVAYSGKHSVLAWMIDSGIVPLNAKVYYMNRRKTRVMLEGSITRDGIDCNCCKGVISVAEFEKHAGSKPCHAYENLCLENGTSLMQCQLDSWNKQEEVGRSGFHSIPVDGDDPNDDTCGVCGDGGDLVCCDGCPSTFHNDCLDVEEVPSGEWHCVYCSCKYCGDINEAASENDDDCEPPPSSLVSCSLCEEKCHRSCVEDEDVCSESKQPTFCGKDCEQIFVRLQSLLGNKHDLGDGFSFTLLQRADVQPDASTSKSQNVLSNSKLAVALSIMDECFLPIIDHRSGINLIRHVVYNCGSNFKRLNFSGFFTIILERGDEVISAASIRIRGKQLAEMPFIGTRNVYRRQGMCRRLLNAIEAALASLEVENLVIPAIPELLQTWTSIFGFKPLEQSIKEDIRSLSMLVFPHTDMLQKPLSKQEPLQKHVSSPEDNVKCAKSENDEHMIDAGADKSEVDDGCLNGTFDLNTAAPTLPESSSPDDVDNVQPENGPQIASSEPKALKPDLNLMMESVDEEVENPSPRCESTTLQNGHQDTDSKSSREERAHDFDLNLVEENVPEFKLPSDLGH